MIDLEFTKMHGLGNDFVIIDNRERLFPLTPDHYRHIADRRRGVGCDQVLVLQRPRSALADFFLAIFNPDGSEAQACGNGTRCVASLALSEKRNHLIIETLAGLLDAELKDKDIQVDMGRAKFDWRDIPLSKPCDSAHLPIELGPLKDGFAVSIGNPHAVFFVDSVETIDLEQLGPRLETHPLFPERANIEIVTVISSERLRMRVWERGAGITQACGSGACASAIAAHQRGFTSRKISVDLDGGRLEIEWLKDNHVKMSGPVATAFTGRISLPD